MFSVTPEVPCVAVGLGICHRLAVHVGKREQPCEPIGRANKDRQRRCSGSRVSRILDGQVEVRSAVEGLLFRAQAESRRPSPSQEWSRLCWRLGWPRSRSRRRREPNGNCAEPGRSASDYSDTPRTSSFPARLAQPAAKAQIDAAMIAMTTSNSISE